MRRIALLHQLGWRGKTDEMRLFRYSIALGHENEFFIQKGNWLGLARLCPPRPT
ncbi:DNA alkylation repair protein [Massilia eburnea]|uniref:DNA alkylation repair protein n=1 Tax=Massilia eburnea TaxID=1776165 RepID=UPI003D6AFE26